MLRVKLPDILAHHFTARIDPQRVNLHHCRRESLSTSENPALTFDGLDSVVLAAKAHIHQGKLAARVLGIDGNNVLVALLPSL